jgi:hypothetical protein
VAAGAIAEKFLKQAYGIEIVAFVTSVGKIHLPSTATTTAPLSDTPNDDDSAEDPLSPDFLQLLSTVTRAEVDKFLTRCPHTETSEAMTQRILRAKAANDSIGGTVTCVIRNAPPGLGEPVFDKFEATLAHAMLSIPATKAFELGVDSGVRRSQVVGTMILLSRRPMERWGPNPTGAGVLKVVSPMARTSTSGMSSSVKDGGPAIDRPIGLASSRRRLFPKHSRRLNTMELLEHWQQEGGTILVWSLEQCRSLRRWLPWF